MTSGQVEHLEVYQVIREVAPGCPRLHLLVRPEELDCAIHEIQWVLDYLLEIRRERRKISP